MMMYKSKKLLILFINFILFFMLTINVSAMEVEDFSCTEDYQEFVAPEYGNYKIELWGAAGGKNLDNNSYTNSGVRLGGKGAYTSGVITLNKNEKIYVYVGCKGRDAKKATIVAGGYNGGGRGDHDHSDDEASGAGGGATDVRLVKGDNWDDFTSLKSRIMIAGGGGGASYELRGGNAGTLSGEDTLYSKGGTQTTGYKFGIGQDGVYVNSNVDVAGGGGGYFGGFAKSSGASNSYKTAGAGGSSFVSGCTGCTAISGNSTENNVYFLDSNIHYSNYKFSDIVMKSGSEEMPNYLDNSVITGNSSDGHARITLINGISHFTKLDIENATIVQKLEDSVFEYDVIIPNDNFLTTINYETSVKNVTVFGAGKVTLKAGEVHTVSIIDNDTGDITIYNITPSLKKSTLKSISFNEKQFDFNPDQYEYTIEVPYNVFDLTPIIETYENTTYTIEKSTLKIGNNLVKINVSTQGMENSTYIFHVKRQESNNLKTIYESTGSSEEYVVPYSGYYEIELWGAAGGRGRTDYVLDKYGGKGGYTKGTIYLEKGTILYFYVGGKGLNAASVSRCVGGLGGYNGGAQGGIDGNCDSNPEPGAGGGGATDVRLVGGDWNNIDSLKSRIMVAGGGGGGTYSYVGSSAGGLNGYAGGAAKTFATQISGNAFGYATMVSNSDYTGGPGGSGSGYYGGITNKSDSASGGGGSSFISGHAGSIAINIDGTPKTNVYTELDNSIHYSNYKFEDTVMIDGNGYEWTTEKKTQIGMPTFDGKSKMNGNENSGYAKITFLGREKEDTLDSITLSSGTLDPVFDTDIKEYNVTLDSSISKLTVDATSPNPDLAIYGLGEYDIPSGKTDINIQLTSAKGNVNLYTIHVTREANSNKYLSNVLINGIKYDLFSPNKFEYNIELPTSTNYVDLEVIKGSTSQEVTGTGKFEFSDNSISKTILVVSEDKNESQHYIFNFTRKKSTKLKSIDLGNELIKNFDFSSDIYEYDIEIPDNILELNINTIAYYNGASIEIVGGHYLEKSGVITITSKLEGLEDTVYKINYTKTSNIDVPENLYEYTGNVQTFTALYGGKYKIELWGAAGGRGRTNYVLDKYGGSGGYTSGEIILNQNQNLYVYVGGKGKDSASVSRCVGGLGGYNGGAQGGIDGNCDSGPEPGAGGGGATDVRLVGGIWNDTDSLKSRIMVAGGGGGATYNVAGSSAGGLEGYIGNKGKSVATQIFGNAFGYATMVSDSDYTVGPGGAGSGYYAGTTSRSDGSSGGGGSSFISGHAGSIAINEDGNPKTTLFTTLSDSYHYSNFVFTNTVMIDGKGYNWTTTKEGITSMPDPYGGYYKEGTGNSKDGYARITLLSTLSSNNFLDSLTINDGDISIPFKTWITEYDLNLEEDDESIKIFAEAKDEDAAISGLGVVNVPPGNSKQTISVTASDGSVRNYVLNIKRKGSSDPYPLDIQINKMNPYLCQKNSNYCNYTFDKDITNYEITLPFMLNEVEVKPILKSGYQSVIYRKVEEGNTIELENGTFSLINDINTYEVEVTSEDGTQNTVYTYVFKRDMTGNNNLTSLKIVNPDIEIDFDPYKYEYYGTITSAYTSYDVEAIPESSDAKVSITGNTNLVLGINDAMVIVTASNGDTKTYLLHIYKEQDSNVFLKELEVVGNGSSLELSPQFNKLLNDYVISAPSNVKSVTINATPESGSASVTGLGNKDLKSGINNFSVQVTSESGDVNVYNLTINKDKNSNPLLSNIEIDGYTFNEEFSPTNYEYYLKIPKDVTSLDLNVTPQESTTNYRISGNRNLVKVNNTITIHSVAENQTTRDYYIYVTKHLSSNNYLKDIKLNTGTLNEAFNKETLEYTMDVSSDVDSIDVTGILDDSSSIIKGNGTYYLSTGVNVIKLIVQSETEEERTYTITINKDKNDDAGLKEIKNSAGSSVILSDSGEYQYLINVQYEVNQIEINGIPNVSTSTVNGNGTYSLKVGNNDIVLSVQSEKGTVKTYIVRVVRDMSLNDDLKYLFVKEGALSPRFQDTTILYDVKIPSDVNKLTIDAITEDENATYEIIGNQDFVEGVEKEVIVRVTAQHGNTKDYKLRVVKQKAITEEFYLDSLSIDSGTLSPTFDPKTQIYYASVDHDVDEITLTGSTNDSNVRVYGNGTYSLNVGKNPLAISVINGDGIQKDYQVIVTRKESNDATLSSLVVKGSTLSPKFNKKTDKYTLNTSKSSLEFSTIKTTESDATYEIIGNQDFTTGINTVTIRVTAPDKTTTHDYVLSVNKSANTNNNLATLSVLGNNFVPNFHKGVTTYTISVDNNINNIVVAATPEVSTSVVSGVGSHQIGVGTNQIDITVMSEAGTAKKYTIIVTKDGSDNNYLSNLYTSEGVLTPVFDKDTLEYTVDVSNEIDKIEIDGKLEDLSSNVEGFKTYSLNEGENSIYITVTSESGVVRTYRIIVNREENVSSYLKELSVDDYDLSPSFDKENLEYFINVNNETTSLNINAIPEDEKATYEIKGNQNFVIGMNEVTIKVTAEDGTETEYILYVNRNLSTNNYLNSIELSEGTLVPNFDPNTMSYDVEVDNNVTSIYVNAVQQDSQSIVTTGNGLHNLVTGENTILIKVKSAIGVYRTYTLNINRKKSDNNYLSSLSIISNNKEIPFDFNKEKNDYSISVDSSVEYITLKATKEDSNASISNTGVKKLNLGSNEFEIPVVSESGMTNIYKITINREASTNNAVKIITPSVGTLTPEFNTGDKVYTLNVTKNDSLLSFEVELEDSRASVSGNEQKIIPDGDSVRTITITAEDGSTNIYTFNVVKESQSEVRLSSLKIKGYEFEFDKDTFTYNVSVSRSKKKLLESEIEAIPIDSEASVNLMGDIELLKDSNNVYTIEVIAKDGYTTQEYKLNITRDNDLHTINSDTYEIIRDDEDYTIGSNPNTNIESYKNGFKNNSENLVLYDKDNNKIDDNSQFIGTSMTVKLEENDVVYDELKIIVRGDITKDGKVDLTDQISLVNYVGKISTFDNDQLKASDLTKDGRVDLTDQIKLVNYVGKIITDINK